MNNTESLQSLIDQAVAKRKTSVRQLGFLAQEAGFKIVGTTLGHIRGGRYKSTPSDDTIRAIAWLSGVEDSVAFAAAGQPVPGPPLADELPPGADHLSPKSRKAVVEMVRVLVDLEAGNNAERTPLIQKPSPDGQLVHEQVNDGSNSRTLRAVAPTSDTSQGQKTEPEGSIIEFHGAEALEYPAPPIESLAAHPKVKTKRQLLDEETGERDETTKDSDRYDR